MPFGINRELLIQQSPCMSVSIETSFPYRFGILFSMSACAPRKMKDTLAGVELFGVRELSPHKMKDTLASVDLCGVRELSPRKTNTIPRLVGSSRKSAPGGNADPRLINR